MAPGSAAVAVSVSAPQPAGLSGRRPASRGSGSGRRPSRRAAPAIPTRAARPDTAPALWRRGIARVSSSTTPVTGGCRVPARAVRRSRLPTVHERYNVVATAQWSAHGVGHGSRSVSEDDWWCVDAHDLRAMCARAAASYALRTAPARGPPCSVPSPGCADPSSCSSCSACSSSSSASPRRPRRPWCRPTPPRPRSRRRSTATWAPCARSSRASSTASTPLRPARRPSRA